MFAYIFDTSHLNVVTVVGIAIIFFACFIALKMGLNFLPSDGGRDVTGGAISKGKPTGAGVVMILAFDTGVLLFSRLSVETFIYLLLVSASMITGFLDDKSSTEWGRLKKGLFDLSLAVIFAITYLHFNPSTFQLAANGALIHIHPFIYALLIIVLVWGSINVTNCADGVDGLTGSLSFVTLLSMMALLRTFNIDSNFRVAIMFMLVCLIAYLWFNASPSRLMMGDAGSRALGLFIAICAVKSHHPLLYLLLAVVLIIDGGLGLIKITLIKATKRKIMSGIRTPIHDHCRKVFKWSDTQVVVRFVVIQALICLGVMFYIYLQA